MFTVSVSGVLLLFLLHHSTLKSVDGQVDQNTLPRLITFFQKNYSINGKQYAVAINVPTYQCEDGFVPSRNNFLTNVNAENVKTDITNNANPVYQGTEQPRQLIAAGVQKLSNTKSIHSERLLLYPTDENPTAPMIDLLNIRDDSCTILYSLNSPCTKTCLNVTSPNNILTGLGNWRAHRSIKAFVFKHIFIGEVGKPIEELRSALQRIANIVHLYRCKTDTECLYCGGPNGVLFNNRCADW